MAVDKSISPYFDDYDENKQFLQVLFKPEKAVQVRELNQVQSILQKQVDRVGKHLFKDGAMIIPGEINFDVEFRYVKITTALTINDLNASIGGHCTGQTSATNGNLIAVEDADGGDPVTLYIKYTDSGTSGVDLVFQNAEVINIYDSTNTLIGTATVTETGIGSAATIGNGIYFVNGYFAIVTEQVLVLDKYTNISSYRVGLNVIESTVSSDEDSTLFDNASGAINFTAPGADRLKVELSLAKQSLASNSSVDFIELMRLENSEIKTKVRTTDYAVLEETLARRTFDESGDYIIDKFEADIREHLTQNNNDGMLIAADGGDDAKFVISLDEGNAYVRGYNVKTESTTHLENFKARDTEKVNNSISNLLIGNYITVSGVNSLPDVGVYETVTLKTAGDVTQGTARVRSIGYIDGTNWKMYLFDLKNNSGVADVSFISTSTKVVDNATREYTIGNSNIVSDTDRNSLLFRLPYDKVQTLKEGGVVDTSFTVVRQYDVVSNASGTISISAGSDEIFAGYSTANYILALADGTGIQAVIDGTDFNLGGAPTGKSLTIDNMAISTAYRLYATVSKQLPTEKVKTSSTLILTNKTLTSGILSLGKADVYKITSITKTTGGQDVSEWFDLNDKKTENFYGISQLELKSEYEDPTNIDVTVEYYVHSVGDYFTVDSYSSILYDDIPTEIINGEEVSLSDVIDFRPRIDDTGADFSGAGSSYSHFPKPNTFFRADFYYYLNRIDKVCLSYDGDFVVVNGRSAIFPEPPLTPQNTLLLYTVEIPAYTKSVDDINVVSNEKRRYTMQDIGKLEKRISRLEYYTTLSVLEKETADMMILDGSGLNRFKNGFLVDPFNDHLVGMPEREDYACSIDTEQGQLRPEFYIEGEDLEYNVASSAGVTLIDDMVMMPYSEQTLIDQDLTSSVINVNPYNVFSWAGNIKLRPTSDSWADTRYTEPKIVEKNVVTEKKVTQHWGWHKHRWWGWRNENDRYQNIRNNSTFGYRHRTEVNFGTIGRIQWNALPRPIESVSQKQIGDKVVSTSVKPYMRKKDITINGKGFKPLTVLYPFFDNQLVTTYCIPNGGSLGGEIKTDGVGDVSLVFKLPNTTSKRFRSGIKTFLLVDNNERDLAASQTSASSRYSSKGSTTMRRKTMLSTRQTTNFAYTHEDRPPQHQTPDIVPALPTVLPVIQPLVYRSALTTIPSPTTPIPVYEGAPTGINGSNIIRPRTDQWNFQNLVTTWRDPLAQSFLVQLDGGVFLTSIEVYFQTKSTTVPVTLELRDMANGYPGPNVYPDGAVTLDPASVNISADGTLATKFTFDHPIYIEHGTEVCFVLMTNTDKFNVYKSTLNQKVLGTNENITKQPYAGVMFKSQNNSTWTSDQESDLKFKINRALFTTGTVGKIVMNNVSNEDFEMDKNSIKVTNASNTIEIYKKNHGLFVGSKVTISNAVGGFNIPDIELNTQHTVTAVADSKIFSVDVVTNANESGWIGGTSALMANNHLFNVLSTNIKEIILAGTNIQWTIKTTSGRTPTGNETPWVIDGSESIFRNEEDNVFNTPRVILSDEEETNRLVGAKSLVLTGYVSTDLDNISPIVDIDGSAAVYVTNRVNNPTVLAENAIVKGGNAESRYFTKPAVLSLPATSLKVFIDINRPQGTEVLAFYKIANTELELEDAEWTSLTGVSITNESDDGTFVENEFGIDALGEFTAYQIKIVMLSDSSSLVPRCDRLRVIALGT